MKTQSYRKGWAFVLTLALVFTTLFGGFGFLGINGMVGEVYAATPRSTTLDLTSMAAIDNVDEGWEWDGTSTLTLSGINLSTTSSTGIIVPTNTAIVLVGDDNHVESAQASGASSYGIYAVNGLTISGSGTLTVTGGAIDSGNYTYGIYVDKGSTTINSGTITASGGTASGINGRSIGIYHTGWTLTINGGTVTATGGTSSGVTGISNGLCGGGNLVMNGGFLNATGGTATNNGSNWGISYVDSIQFNGGTTTVTTNNATQRGAVFGMNGITLDTDQWISSPAGVGLNSGGNNIVTLSDGTTRATSAIISPYIAPTISVNDSSVTEGNSGSINLGFIVSLSAASVQTVTVNYATANGTATAGSDYSSTSGALSFAPGETSKTVNVEITGDTTVESNETIFLNLSSPTKATISDAQGIGTITNDDAADTTPPAAPVIVTPANGSITNNNAPTCSGTAEVGSTITVRVDGTTVGTTTANGSGNWIYTSAALAEGSHTVQSTATDGAGNTSANSSSNSFTVDTTQPTLSGATASAITKNSATLNFTSNEAGTYYYLIYASAAGAPDEATIKAQGASIAKGTAAAIAAANTSNVSGLAASTTYKAYVILEDQATNQSAVSTITFTTRAEYPTALVNSSFEIPTLGATLPNWWTDYTPTTPEAKTAFGWKTTATGTNEKFEVGGDWNTTGWGIGFIPDGRQFIELNANTQAAAYQDLNTTPGSVIYWSLYQGGVWYSSSPNINNTMAVRIGSPEQLSTSAIMIQTTDTGYDQRWTTRTIYNNATMTAINTTPTTYGAMELTKKILYTEPKRWTKYEGTYTVPAGQTETRFAFASLSAEPTQGNLLDGVVFRIANTTKAITAFNFNGLTPNVTGTINEGANTIALTVPYGTDVTALVPTITHTGASVSPSAVVAQNFTGPVTYTVTPETGAAQEYVVTVTVAMPTKAITAFNFNGLTPNVTGTVNETAKTIALTVPYGTDVTALVPTITYSGVSITSNSGIAQNFTSPVTYTVTAADSSTQAYIVTVTVASNGGGGHSSTSTAPANATVNVNGQSQAAGTVSTSKVGDKTVTTVTIDDKKIQEKIKEEANQSTVSIPIGGSSDIGEGVLNGQTIKDMENKESVLEIKTNSTTYTLPASEINIDSVSSQFGQTVELKDIKISVKIAEPSTDTTKIVQDTANKNNYQVVVKPVDFEITCTSGSKTVSVTKFNGYVERMVAIPDGIDPSKVTTGIVLNNDGTFSHVPTTIVKIDGKYYAKINSLTNSTYSVIYNPIEFADVAKHWAKDSINEMGSRLVISGVGEDKFEPNRDITRAEFAAIMVRALGLAPDTAKNNFSDVADSKWYSGYVGTAASYGIISGYETDTFAPNDKITREQAMTMVARAMAITDLDTTTADLNAGAPLAGYSDTNKISGYAKAGITACLKTGVVTGKTADTIAPKKNITRAEVAVIIERLLKKSELI